MNIITKTAAEIYDNLNDYLGKKIVKVELQKHNFDDVCFEIHKKTFKGCEGKLLIGVKDSELFDIFGNESILPGVQLDNGDKEYFNTADIITLDMGE